MSDDVTNEVFPEVAVEAAPEAAPVEVEQPAPEPEKPEALRGPDGRFAKAEVVDEGEEDGAPPAPGKEDDHHVPRAALKDERAKRQAAERELADLRAWRQQIEARARDQRIQSIQDPDERAQAINERWQQDAIAQRREMSRKYAERQFGVELVNRVVEFFNDPAHAPISHQLVAMDDPFGAAVEYYNAQQALSEIGSDPQAYRERLRAEIRAEIAAESSSAKPKAPPPSMAGSPASGGASSPHGSGYDQMFGQ